MIIPIFVNMTIKYKVYQGAPLKLVILLFIGMFYLQTGFSQIVGEEIEAKKEKKKKREPIDRDSLTGTTYYLTYLYNYGYRRFEDKSVFGSYADWNDQKAARGNGLTLGVFLPVAGNLSMDVGVTFFGHKEEYNYSDPNTDSTYHYTQSYIQLGMPLKLRYTIGNQFQFFGFAGVTPLNVFHVRYLSDYTTALGGKVERDVELIKEKLSIFNLMGNVGFGITYNMDWLGITIYPEYRHHFFNTYNSQKPIDHRMYGLGVNAGLTLRF